MSNPEIPTSAKPVSPARFLKPVKLPSPFLLTVISYVAVIVGVIVWSGQTVEKTLYDKYIIYWEGAILPVSSIAQARAFYRDVLNFTEVDTPESGTAAAFLITPKKRLLLQATPQPPADGTVLIVRVRNGFGKLHDELVKRTHSEIEVLNPAQAIDAIHPGQVSQVYQGPWGKQFVIRDTDHNRIVFYEPFRKLFGASPSSPMNKVAPEQ